MFDSRGLIVNRSLIEEEIKLDLRTDWYLFVDFYNFLPRCVFGRPFMTNLQVIRGWDEYKDGILGISIYVIQAGEFKDWYSNVDY